MTKFYLIEKYIELSILSALSVLVWVIVIAVAITAYKRIENILSVQSMLEHDNDVIEKCAKVVEGMIEYASVIDAVRALKGKQND